MQLITFTVEGYRRFVDRTSIKLHADMVALVGPNEAGKSSLLKGLTHLNSDARFATNELPRRSEARPLLMWQFQLDLADRESLATVPEASEVERISISKGDDGVRRWSFFPAVERDRSPRRAAGSLLLSNLEELGQTAVTYGLELEYVQTAQTLDSNEDYDSSDFEQLISFADRVSELPNVIPAAEMSSTIIDTVNRVQQSIRALVEIEQEPHPTERARAALESRVPVVRLFDVEDRDLQREYDLNEVAAAPPAALRHLADLGELDLVALRDEIAEGLVADASTRRNEANRKLVAVFESWNQEEIALQFEFQSNLLLIQATTPSDNGLSSLEDRSDGMRWFAALLAFTSGAGELPILLADEIETHLHYDAQADLLEVLSQQSLTSKVIYTTHSFGCLPYDIGNGVRVVQQTGPGTSRLANGFWNDGSGFSPLLASMGAAAVSFTPTRRGIVAEGATEAILLPTLLRQAAGVRKLNFQVAPGLASVAASDVVNLETEAGQVAYLVDGDTGGQRIKTKLIRTVPQERVVSLFDVDDSPMETEDLISPSHYVAAVNEELQLWNSSLDPLELAGAPATMRTKWVEGWCRRHHVTPPDKAAVAQRIVNQSGLDKVFDESRQQYLIDLLATLEEALSFTPPTPV